MARNNYTNTPQEASANWLDMDSQQRLSAIRRVFSPGMSLTHIAFCIAGATRNGVVGYFHRNPELAIQCPLTRPSHAGSKKSRPRPTGPKIPTVRKSKPMPVSDAPASEPVSMNLTIDQFTANSCKWPTSRTDEIGLTYFCGHPRDPDRSYCAYHQRRSVSRGTESERTAHRILAKEMLP